jgi:hypothetical protein
MRLAYFAIAIPIALIFNISFNTFPPVIYQEVAGAQTSCLQRPDASLPVTLTWVDKATNEDGVRIERKLNAGTYSLLNSVGPNVTTFQDSTIAQATVVNRYTYRLFAFNSSGDSPEGVPLVCVDVAALIVPPAAPSGITIK